MLVALLSLCWGLRLLLISFPSRADMRFLCSAHSFIFKVITYINEAGQRGVSPRSLEHCFLIIVSDKRLKGDVLPVDSCGDSRGVYSEEEQK